MMSGLLTEEDCARICNHPMDVTAILLIDFLFQGENLLEKSSNLSNRARQAGNDLYNQRNHTESIHSNILLNYTKCIALAPRGSEELALGYSNRSVLLMHLRHYQECLNDIEKANQITKSIQIKRKLQDRKEACVRLLHSSDARQRSLEEATQNLSLNSSKDEDDKFSKFLKLELPSDVLPDASDSVTLHYNDTFGRHLIANRDIKPGEVIINEKGFICFPNNNQLYLVCSHCLQFAWNAIPCDYCALTVYCSEACKKQAWEEYHDEECSTLPYFYFLTRKANIVDVMATSRLLIKAIRKEGLSNVLREAKISNEGNGNGIQKLLSDGKLQNDKFRSYCNLMYNKNRIPSNEKDKQEYYETIAINILFRHTNLIRPKGSQLELNSREEKILIKLKKFFVKFRNIFNTNAITYQGTICNCSTAIECGLKCPTKRGLTIGPCSSLINHSCNPNAEKMFVPNGKIVLFTTAPIKKGEQICESYGILFTTEKAARKKFLKENLFFNCNCTACTENWPTYEEMDFCRDPKTDHVIRLKTLSQFHADFFNETMSLSFNKIVSRLEFDVETLKHAIKFSEWVYEHFDDGMAFMMSITYRTYIDTAFHKLFGERCTMPAICHIQ